LDLQHEVGGAREFQASLLSGSKTCFLPQVAGHGWMHAVNWLIWALLSALFAGMTAVLAKLGVAGVDSNLATAVRTTVVLVFAWAVALAVNPITAVAGLSRRTLLFLVLSGLATGLSWLCYFRALQLGEASKVAPIDKLSVVFVILFAALFLHEPMTWKTCLGGGLIAAGALVLAIR
jgi:transporter family protein